MVNKKDTDTIQSMKTSGVAIVLAIAYKAVRQAPGVICSRLSSLKEYRSHRLKEPVPTFKEGIVVSMGGGKEHPKMIGDATIGMYRDHAEGITRTSFLEGGKVGDTNSFKPDFKIELKKEYLGNEVTELKKSLREILNSDSDTFDFVVASKARTSKVTVYIKSDKDIGTLRNLTMNGTFTVGNWSFEPSGN